MSIKLLVFDVDGTLYPNRAMYLRSIPLLLKNLRLFMAFNEVRKDIRRQSGAISDIRARQAELLGERLGTTTEKARQTLDDVVYTRWEASLKGLPLYPNVRETIARLRARGFATGVLSDFPVGKKMEILGLQGLFDWCMTTEDHRGLKPSREAFVPIVEQSGLPPAEILFIGNSRTYDVEGAHALGMMTAHLARRCSASCPADFHFSDYGKLEQWLCNR